MDRSLNVTETSSPSCRPPNGEPAENNRWNCPRRITPTSIDVDVCVVVRGDGFARGCRIPNLQIKSAMIDETMCYHRASP